MKIHPMGAESFHADTQTDMTKPMVTLHSFVNTPNNSLNKTTVSCLIFQETMKISFILHLTNATFLWAFFVLIVLHYVVVCTK